MQGMRALGPVLLLTACGGAPDSAATPSNAAGTVAHSSVAQSPAPDASPDAAAETGMAADASPQPASMGDANGLPADVAAFRKRREECDHFRGEEPYDAERAAELRKALDRTCKGTDAELASLRRRHAGEKATIAALSDYEATVEPPVDEE